MAVAVFCLMQLTTAQLEMSNSNYSESGESGRYSVQWQTACDP